MKPALSILLTILLVIVIFPIGAATDNNSVAINDKETPGYPLDLKSIVILPNYIIFKTCLNEPLHPMGNASSPAASITYWFRATLLIDIDSNASSGLQYRRSPRPLSLDKVIPAKGSVEELEGLGLNSDDLNGSAYYSPPGTDVVVRLYGYFDMDDTYSFNATFLSATVYYANGTVAARRIVWYPNLTFESPGSIEALVDRGFISEFYMNTTGKTPGSIWRAYIIGTWSRRNPTISSDSLLYVADYVGGNTTLINRTIIINGDFSDWPESPALLDSADGIAPSIGAGNVTLLQFAYNGSLLFLRIMNEQPYPNNPDDSIGQDYYGYIYFRADNTTYELVISDTRNYARLKNLGTGDSYNLYLNENYWRSEIPGKSGLELGLNLTNVNITLTPGGNITVYPNSTIYYAAFDYLNTTTPHILGFTWSADSVKPFRVNSIAGTLNNGISTISINGISLAVNVTGREEFIVATYPFTPINAGVPEGLIPSIYLYFKFQDTSLIQWPLNITIPTAARGATPYYYDKTSNSYKPVPDTSYEASDHVVVIHVSKELYNMSDPIIGLYYYPSTVGGELAESEGPLYAVIVLSLAAVVVLISYLLTREKY